jgi:FKBP-type peptidyl-prolyl cis-trans isomerase FkpA
MIMKMRFVLFGLFAFTVLLISSCGKDKTGYWDQEEQNATDRKLIEEYAEANNLDGSFTSSGLYYVIIEQGGMARPTTSSSITVNYKGYYLDGVKLDEGTLDDYPLSHLIQGWQEGIQYIGKGGNIKLIIPSVLGYGHNPPNGVRQDAVTVFDIELLDFTN